MDFLLHLLVLVAIYVILGVTLNLLVGHAGLLSLAHASFFGVGAYATAVLTTTYAVSFFVSMLLGALLAACLSLVTSLALARLKGDYYALASLGFNTIVFSIFLGWRDVTGGPLGIAGIASPVGPGGALSSAELFSVMSVAIAATVSGCVVLLSKSAYGRTLRAIRDDERAAQMLGYETHRYTLSVSAISAGLAATAGSLYAGYISYVEPNAFTALESIFILAVVIVGGLASFRGTILGAGVLVVLPELLRFVGFPAEVAGHVRSLTFGLALAVLMLFRPQGLLGRYKL